jgi:hypothetical protein
MSEQPIVIARFEMPAEAQLACGRLQAEGISAHVVGQGGAAALGFLVSIGGQIELYVNAADAPRAQQILAACMPNERWRVFLDDHQERAPAAFSKASPDERLTNMRYEDDDALLWLCSLCGDAISVSETVCAACGTPREAPGQSFPEDRLMRRSLPRAHRDSLQKDRPAAAVPLPEPDPIVEDLSPAHRGDLLASRALKSALLSCLVPLLFMISLPQLIHLMLYSGEFSSRGTWKIYVALILNVFAGLWFLYLLAALTHTISWSLHWR